LSVSKDEGFKEIVSKNFIDWYKKNGIKLNQWVYKDEAHRVGYVSLKENKQEKTYIFEVNSNFYDIFDKDDGEKEKFILLQSQTIRK
jgi:hypothetical protein